MAWQNEMVLILRHLIDDLGTPETYDIPRLEESLYVAAQLVTLEVDFPKTYVIDVDAPSLTPDPTAETRDNAFINLVCLKGASNILCAEAKASAANTMIVQDGPSKIDLTFQNRSKQATADKAVKAYEDAKFQYVAGNGSGGQAILGPFVNENIGIRPWNF